MEKTTLKTWLTSHNIHGHNCPPNTSNLSEFPHFFASLQNDYFKSFPYSSSLSHSPHLVTSLHVSWSKYKPSHRKSLIFYHQIYTPPCISTNFLLFPSSWNGKCVFPPTRVQTLLWWALSLWPSQGLHSVINPSLSDIIRSLFLPSCAHQPKNTPQYLFLKEKKQTFITDPRLHFISISLLLLTAEPLKSIHFLSNCSLLHLLHSIFLHYKPRFSVRVISITMLSNLVASSLLFFPVASDKLKHSWPEILGMLWVSKHSGLYVQGKR